MREFLSDCFYFPSDLRDKVINRGEEFWQFEGRSTTEMLSARGGGVVFIGWSKPNYYLLVLTTVCFFSSNSCFVYATTR